MTGGERNRGISVDSGEKGFDFFHLGRVGPRRQAEELEPAEVRR